MNQLKSKTTEEIVNAPYRFLHKKESKISIPKIALVGNPNCGKTTLFNHLTGSAQYVGNWPGVTVERKEGRLKNSTILAHVVDLPGIYSLSPYSPEEIITRNYIMDEKPDLIINIIDSTNLERSLYLTTQLTELGCKMLLALNMSDLLEKKGKTINYNLLSKKIGLPVIPISASKNNGLDELIEQTQEIINYTGHDNIEPHIYSKSLENILSIISVQLKNNNVSSCVRFNAVKFFEGDPLVISKVDLPEKAVLYLNRLINSCPLSPNIDREMLIADQRYKYICDICDECVKPINAFKKHISISSKIDDIVTGRFTAIPLFVFLMLSIFFVTFGPFGTYLKNQTEQFIRIGIGNVTEGLLGTLNASVWSKSLIMDAVIGGVGAVISFLPQILILFTLLSLLEDSGYMARAVFIMDKVLSKLGLSGKAFVPLIMGFGCSVPAILGTRILEDKKNKRLTIFLIPFMSCSAKTPTYLLFASIFFPHSQFLAISLLYILGIILAIFTAFLFKDSLFKGQSTPFIMELPDYKIPSMKNLRLHIWDRVKDFIERAGTVILSATIVIWFLQSFDKNFTFVTDSSKSILSSIGSLIAPVFTLCGFGDWRASVSLLTGLIAKESIVSTMTVLYPQGSQSVSNALCKSFTTLSAVSFMVFVLLYTPCVAAVSAMYKELGNLKLTVLSVIYQFLTAFLISALVFQVGTLIQKIL